MKLILVAATLGLLSTLGAAHAKNLKNGLVPAEFPPASFKGPQYVDSAGCVFIRAGVGGHVNWVPRVTRQRRALCGQTPTFGSVPRPAKVPVAQTKAPARTVAAQPVAARRTVTPQVQSPAPAPASGRRNAAAPAGYKPAWEDGRLNPQRPSAALRQAGALQKARCAGGSSQKCKGAAADR